METTTDVREQKKLLKASEFAELAGITVRTLHHYDRLKLLRPTTRTTSGYRLYGEAELARLQHIQTLKFLGMSLHHIRDVLNDEDVPLISTLRMQREVIRERVERLQSALVAIARAERSLDEGTPDWKAFRTITEVLEMEQNNKWFEKYYTPEALEKLAHRREELGASGMAEGEQAWKVLIADVEKAIAAGERPDSPTAQALASRWKALIHAFTGGDAQVSEGLKKVYADQQNWPKSFQKPYSDDVGAFICEAMGKKQ